MAKGVEDTAFYRYVRLLALNDVGGDPSRFGIGVDAFHAANAERAARVPRNLLVSSTHDTKRSGDARARLCVLAGMADEWAAAVRRWREACAPLRTGGAPDPVEEYTIFQTLACAWPLEPERLVAYMEKAMRERKVTTNWLAPDAAHEAAVLGYCRALYDHRPFLRRLRAGGGGDRPPRGRGGAAPDGAEADRPGRARRLPGRRAARVLARRPGQPAARRLGGAAAAAGRASARARHEPAQAGADPPAARAARAAAGGVRGGLSAAGRRRRVLRVRARRGGARGRGGAARASVAGSLRGAGRGVAAGVGRRRRSPAGRPSRWASCSARTGSPCSSGRSSVRRARARRRRAWPPPSSGDGVSGSSWSHTKRKSMTPVSIVACTPSTL